MRPARIRIAPPTCWGSSRSWKISNPPTSWMTGYALETAAVTSAYPVIPLVGGLLIFRERLLPQQVGGAILILGGLILLGLGS